MSLRIGDEAPDFTADSTQGTIYFHEWAANSWAILLQISDSKQISHLENSQHNRQDWQSEFSKRNAKCLGISSNNLDTIIDWKDNLEIHHGYELSYPLVSDKSHTIAKHYGMLEPLQNPHADNFHYSEAYKLFIIAPDKCIKLMLNYPDTSIIEFSEILTLLDTIQASTNAADGLLIASGHSQSFYNTTTLT